MRITIFTLLLFLCVTGAFGQLQSEQAKVLQKCLDLTEIQQFLPVDAQGHPKPVYIMQLPMVLPVDAAVSKFGSKPIYMSRSEINDAAIEAFFQFREIAINGNQAQVIMTYSYNFNHKDQKVRHYTLKLQKSGNDWNIVTTELTGGIL